MANVDEEARKNGVRFRHYYSYSNKHIATIATRISEYGNQIVDVGVAFCSVKDEPDKIKAKTIAMGRVLQGSKKFMTSFPEFGPPERKVSTPFSTTTRVGTL